jgi:hypothetical protein
VIIIGANVGYLTAAKTDESNENYTPYYAVEPIMKYIDKKLKVWLPFDEEWSAYYNTFKDNGYDVIRSCIQECQDFFTYEPEEYDVIVSNPPFNVKDKILKRLDELGKPFAILLPMNSLQGASRYKCCFKNGIQLLAFDQRIGFHSQDKMDEPIEGSPFASAYFCRNVLPKDLIVEELIKYKKPLINNNRR